MSDLVANARFFIEGQYVTPDDAVGGNGNNNVSHVEISVQRDANGQITIQDLSGPNATLREAPAIMAWPYAQFSIHDASPGDGRIVVAYKVTKIKSTKFRYDYAVYNMNSDRGIRAFSVPSGGQPTNSGFSAVTSHEEPWSNDPWTFEVAGDEVLWWVEASATNL